VSELMKCLRRMETRKEPSHCLKLKITSDITKRFFSNRVVNRWNLLDAPNAQGEVKKD